MNKFETKIDIPDKLELAVQKGMNKVNRIHRRHLMQKTLTTAVIAVVACGAFLGWGYKNPVLAAQIPILGRIFAQYESVVSFSGSYDGRVEVLEEIDEDTESTETAESTERLTASAKGITVQVKEVYCDGESLYAGVNMTYEDGFGLIASFATSPFGETQAQCVDVVSVLVKSESGEEVDLTTTIEGSQLSETEFEGLMKINLKNNGITVNNGEKLILDIQGLLFVDIDKHEKRDFWDSWTITIPICVDTEHVKNYVLDEGNESFTLHQITVTPYEIKIETEIPDSEWGYEYALFDQDGNRLFWEEAYWVDDNWNHTVYVFAVKEREIESLSVYYCGEVSDTNAVHEMSAEECKENAIYSTVIDISE